MRPTALAAAREAHRIELAAARADVERAGRDVDDARDDLRHALAALTDAECEELRVAQEAPDPIDFGFDPANDPDDTATPTKEDA